MPLKILMLESFYGGSHKSFADGLVKHSRHDIDLLTMPDRNWRWRMTGAAYYFMKNIPDLSGYDLLLTTDLINLSDLKAFYRWKCPPVMVYFHENQITYPSLSKKRPEFSLCANNISTALCSERVVFNSETHLNQFLDAIPDFLERGRDFRPDWVVGEIRDKSTFIYPGCEFPAKDPEVGGKPRPPVVIWNHRWGFDKNAPAFFKAVDALEEAAMDFRLVLLGENSGYVPDEFAWAKERFGKRILRYGYEVSRKRYLDWLKKGSIVVSTAIQENFGIAMVEAMRYGAIPVLPARLSYPEILPEKFHGDFLYSSSRELADTLISLVDGQDKFDDARDEISRAMGCYAWENIIDQYDAEFEITAGRG